MILLTNDDGISAPGLYELAQMLLEFGPVFICAPEQEQSAVGHAITIRGSIGARMLDPLPSGIERLAIGGTPADATKFALRHHLDETPDLVVSGPNTGPNVGVNVLYSGTVGAAYEAVICGVSAVAVSSVLQQGRYDWSACIHFARPVIAAALKEERERRMHPEAHQRHGTARPFLWNLNVPAPPIEKIHGLAVTRHGTSGFDEFFVPHGDEGGDDDGATHYRMDGTFTTNDEANDCDAAALQGGYASLTPLALDSTDYERLDALRETFAEEA